MKITITTVPFLTFSLFFLSVDSGYANSTEMLEYSGEQKAKRIIKKKKLQQGFRLALKLVDGKKPDDLKRALFLLKDVFSGKYVYNAEAYNLAANLLYKKSVSNREHEKLIFEFINREKDFFRFVTLPYYVVAKGNHFQLENLQSDRYFTFFYFTAPWCSICKKYRAQIRKWSQIHGSMVIREIDLGGTNTAAVKDFYRLHRLAMHRGIFTPAIFVYKNKKLIYSGQIQELAKQLESQKE